MDRFSPGRFGDEDPWFKIGNFGITTTIAVAGLAVISMFVWAAEGPGGFVFRNMALLARDFGGGVLSGEVWRLVTWPIPNEPGFFPLLLVVIFYLLGSQLETAMGRVPFTMFLGALVIIPALIVTVLELVTGIDGGASGLRFVELGVLVAFAARNPKALFWPGIPAWIIAGGIIVIETLQLVGTRTSESSQYSLVLLYSMVAVSLLGIRALGHADELGWIPKIPLPGTLGAGLGVASFGGGGSAPTRTKTKRGRKSKLRPVPDPVDDALADAEIDSLLDQVASQGLDSLTSKQRKQLEAHSKRMRKRND
jgi:hypothetical protein